MTLVLIGWVCMWALKPPAAGWLGVHVGQSGMVDEVFFGVDIRRDFSHTELI